MESRAGSLKAQSVSVAFGSCHFRRFCIPSGVLKHPVAGTSGEFHSRVLSLSVLCAVMASLQRACAVTNCKRSEREFLKCRAANTSRISTAQANSNVSQVLTPRPAESNGSHVLTPMPAESNGSQVSTLPVESNGSQVLTESSQDSTLPAESNGSHVLTPMPEDTNGSHILISMPAESNGSCVSDLPVLMSMHREQ